MSYIDNLPKEILTNVIKSAGLASLAAVSQVCSSWSQLIDSSEFWRDYMLRWQNNCCLMLPTPDASAYLFPTRRQGDKLVPDYKRYYFVRKNIEELTEELTGLYEEDNGAQASEFKTTDSELTQKIFDHINRLIDNVYIMEIAQKAFWLRSDFYKIYFERNDPQYKYTIFPKFYELSSVSNYEQKLRFSATYLHLAQFCEKDLEASSNLFKNACDSFSAVEVPNERYGKVFRDLIVQQISFGRFASEEAEKRFKYSIPEKSFVHELIQESTPDADALHEILCRTVQEKFEHNSDDWRTQASALTTIIQATTHDNERVKATAIWLGLEAIKSRHAAVTLHGYVALHSVLVMFENENLTKDETLQLFDALSTAIDTQPRNFGLFFVEAILCLITASNSKIVNDEKLNKLNNSIIEMLSDENSIDEHNTSVLISVCKLGTAFGTRIRSFLLRYKHTLLIVLMKRKVVPAAELLDIYFRLGHGTIGDEFYDDASALFEQAEKGTEEFGTKMDLPLFCALSADILPKVLNWEFKKNSTKILQYIINFFSEEFELLGQSCLFSTKDSDHGKNWPKLPETAEHSKKYFQEVLKRMQNGESLSEDDADEILAQTASNYIADDEDMVSEFIRAPNAFAADAIRSNGETELKQKLQTVQYKRGIVNLMKTTLLMKQEALSLIQRAFHISLAGFRLIFQDERFIRLFTELLKLIATILTKEHLTYYMQIITNDMLHYARDLRQLSGDTIEALHELFTMVFSVAVSNPLTPSKILHNLLEFSSRIDQAIRENRIEEFEHGSLLEYLSVLLTKLPNKTRHAITPSMTLGDNPGNEVAIEVALRASAIIGFSFGVNHLFVSLYGRLDFDFKELRDNCLKFVSKYSPDLSYTIMKSFIVLLSCCMVDDRIQNFIEMRRVFDYSIIGDAINHQDFDTGDETLNEEVKKYANNPFVLFAALKRK